MSAFIRAARVWVSSRGSVETRAAYTRDVSAWEAHCRAARVDPGAPPPEAVVAFRDELAATKAPLTVRRTLACLSAAFAAVQPGHANPFAERALPRPPASNYSRTEAISEEDARQVIAAAAARGEAPLRDAALLWVLWTTGMRRVSAVSIRREGVVRRARLMLLRHAVKGGEVVESEVPADAAAAVDAWLAVAPRSRWLFCTMDGRRAMSPQFVTKVVALASAAVGLHVHPHQFRSALITDALDAGVPLERVRAAVHHKDIRSTLRYDRGQRGAGVAAEVAKHRARPEGAE